jgi:hypothetical protein
MCIKSYRLTATIASCRVLSYMTTTKRLRVTRVVNRTMAVGVASVLSLATAGAASANRVHFEAESVRYRFRGVITSPMMIKDDPAASGGSYLTVAAGINSPSTAPASTTEGVAKYTFSVDDTGSYRIWARVSAATTADDSFWLRMGSSAAWIKWTLPLGVPYHWVLVKPDGSSTPSTFSLTAKNVNELQIAYREDGAKLDAFFITNDTTFNPTAALTGPPLRPIMQPQVSTEAGGGGSAAKVSWSAVPGAASYTLERNPDGCSTNPVTMCCEHPPYQVIATGLTVHQFVDVGGGGQYRVTAVAPTGSSSHPVPTTANCSPADDSEGRAMAGPFKWRTQVPSVLNVTSPMKFFSDGGVGAPAGTNSTAAAPAHGRARMDFELAVPAVMLLWAEITAPTTGQDSFWVRFDDGAWINWNNLGFCSTLYDSAKTGAPIVRTSLGAGSHRLEFAYREGGARLADNIILLEDVPDDQGPQCDD